jgi:hypothetical protein
MYHTYDPATVLRHRAAEIDRMLVAHHRRAQRAERTSAPRSAAARALRWL